MFDIGQTDKITVKKPATTGRIAGNKTLEWDIIIDDQRCRKVSSVRVETDETGAQILIKTEKVIVNYTGSLVDETCMAIVNGSNYDITRVDPARGWGRNFISITIKARV